VNWSFSDDYVRLDVPFGVSYDSDPHEVTRLAIESCAGVERVDATVKRPVCWLTEFGDSSLNFLLRFWIRDPQQGLTNNRGKVLQALRDSFKEHGIQIPYPHREVIVKTPVTVTALPAGAESAGVPATPTGPAPAQDADT
jgi:small-conductance mechanosensitive channel